MEGGKKLGEGAKGIAYDISSKEGGETLVSILQSMSRIDSIQVYTDSINPKPIEDIPAFIKKLDKLEGYFVKIFKTSTGILRSYVPSEGFKEELDSINTVASVVSAKYLPFSAIEKGIHVKGSKDFYALFGKKCDNRYTVSNPKQFVKDLLKCLIELNGAGYYHNDIKPDNIVQCGKIYKFIDWGNVTPNDFVRPGYAYKTSNPIKHFLTRGTLLGIDYLIGLSVKQSWVLSKSFRKKYNQVLVDLRYEVKHHTKKELLDKFFNTFDVYSLGMTLLYILIEFGLDTDENLELVDKLTSFKNPLTAKEAMRLVS